MNYQVSKGADMNNIKIMGVEDNVMIKDYGKHIDKMDYAMSNYKFYCYCCCKEIKDRADVKDIRVIEGGSVWTEFDVDVDESADCGWWFIGPTCYKKYKKAEKEITVRGKEND